ncbi:MAG TPA: P-loop NTPase [Candidatus Polarisedimenticolia bacterium]|nr:P-loop NTPase [Candidatus Polarisedimenticolia bacterium]
MKSYHDIKGDGGSRIVEQVVARQGRIDEALSGVRHLVAVGSGKGGVGKSTLTMHLAAALAARGDKVALLDADLNGPSQARMAGVAGTTPLPADGRMALPRSRAGFGVFSMGSLLPEERALEFDSVARGDSHTWRATREFTFLAEVLGSVAWGKLDALLVDLPPGAERMTQYSEFLGPRAAFVLVTIPSDVSRGVVARSAAALASAKARVLGYVENMDGYACAGCDTVRPLFAPADRRDLGLPCLGRVPFDPDLAAACDRGESIAGRDDLPSARAIGETARRIMTLLEMPPT